MRVAVYARHSTDKQEDSTQDQLDRCRAWCQAQGYTITQAFTDEGISGASMVNRPGIESLTDAIVDGLAERIVTEDLSRLSRDQGDIGHFFKKMDFLDVQIETLAEGLISELHIGLKGTMNALYLKDLSDKTKRGMVAAVKRGGVPGGRIYGYRRIEVFENGEAVRGLREVDPDQAIVVNRIFDAYAQGQTLAEICADLNGDGIPSPTGKTWQQTTLIGTKSRQTGLLRQSLYKGLITFNRMEFRKHPETGKRLSAPRPPEEWILVKRPELALMDKQKYDAVQELIEKRSSMRNRRQKTRAVMTRLEEQAEKATRARHIYRQKDRLLKRYLTSGKLVCAHHDAKLKPIRNGRFNCAVDGCENRGVMRDNVLPLLYQELERFGMKELSAYNELAKANSKALRSMIAIKRKELANKQAQIRSILDDYGKAGPGNTIKDYVSELDLHCHRLSLDLKKLELELKDLAYLRREDKDRIVTRFRQLASDYRRNPDDAEHHEQLASMITSIKVKRHKEGQADRTEIVGVNYDLIALVKILRRAK